MRRHSPYNYAFNNPIIFTDPDGMAPEHIYELMKNGEVKKVKDTKDNYDILVSRNSISGQISDAIRVDDQSILSQLETTNSPPLKKDESKVAMSSSADDMLNVYNFLNKNTYDGIEFGLMKYNKSNKDGYLIGTDYSFDTTSKSFGKMIDIIGGYDNLIGFIHNHDGKTGVDPEGITNQFSADNSTINGIYNSLNGTTMYRPRFFTVHESIGGVMYESTGNNRAKSTKILNSSFLKNLSKRDMSKTSIFLK